MRTLPSYVVALLAGLLLLVWPARAPAGDVPGLAWTAPARVRRVSWPTERAGEASTSAGDCAVAVGADQVLLVDARAGDIVKVTGTARASDLELGLVLEERGKPASIAWIESTERPLGRELVVPLWSDATAVAARPRQRSELTAFVAETEIQTMTWERFEDDAVAWIDGLRAAPPQPPAPTMDAPLRRLAAMRDALGPEAHTPAGRAWLALLLVEAGFMHRPLIAMSYPTAWMKLGGEAPTAAQRALFADLTTPVQWPGTVEWRSVAGGTDLPVEAAGADALQLTVFAAGESPARVVVLAGGVAVRTFDVPGRHAAPVTPGHGRVLLPVARRAVSLHVEGGGVLVGVTAFWNRVGIGDTLTRRRDRAHLAAMAGGPSAGPVLRALAEAWREPGRAAFQSLFAVDSDDLAPGPRALLLWATARLAPSTPAAVDAVEAGWKATLALAPRVAVPLRRALVEALLDRRLDREEVPEPGTPFAGLGRLAPAEIGGDDDVAAIRAGLAALDPIRDGRRPGMAAEASRHALGHGVLTEAKARARMVWMAESAWRGLAPEGPAESVLRWVTPVHQEGFPAGRCSPEGPSGHRWTRLGGGVATLDVRPPAGATHVTGSFRAETRARLAGDAFAIDGRAVPVHGEIGLPSRVALAAGEHRLELAPGAVPVLALFPRADPLPCESLRDLERWVRVDGAQSFRLPAGETETGLRIALRRPGEGTRAEVVTVEAGGARAEVLVVPGEEALVEVPWRRSGSAVTVALSMPALVRVSARLRRLPASAAAPAGTGVLDEEAAIARVRALARLVRDSRDETSRIAHLHERAALLQRLGFTRLAGADLVVAGEALRADEERDDADPPAPAALPPGAGGVVPMNVAARVPVLPSAAAGAISDGDVARMEAGDFAAVVARLAGSPRPPRPDESTLLLGLAADRAQRWEAAAGAYERLALEADSAVAAVEAADVLADLALARRDPGVALRGYLFARRGELAGADARAVRGRLDPAVRFLRPAEAVALGYEWVERRGEDARHTASLASRVRRAFLDAPADAIVVTEGERAVAVLPSSQRVVVEIACAPLFAAGEVRPLPECQALVEVDGSPRACAIAPGGCTLDLSRGPHRVEVELGGPAELVGWVRLREAGAGAALALHSAARWFEIDGTHPLELAFAGPTLVRVAGRGDAQGGGRVGVIIDGAPAGELDLAQPTDPEASRRSVADPVLRTLGEERVAEVVVLAPGAHALRIVADRRTVVLPSVAGPHGLPRARVGSSRQAPAAQAGLLLPDWARAPAVGDDPWPGPFTLSTHAHAVIGYLGNPSVPRNVSADYLELDVQLRRRLFGDRAYVRAGALVRPRVGAPTLGLAGRVDVNGPLGIVPRAFVQGEVYAQQLDQLGVGAQLHSGLWWQMMPTSTLAFVPSVGLDVRRVVKPSANLALVHDPDVYLDPSTIHPRLVFLTLLTSLRPTIDTFLRLRAGMHLDGVSSVVNVYATPSFDISAGRGLWPLASLSYLGTHTFAWMTTKAYDTHILQLQAFFWRWAARGHRITIDSTVRVSLAGFEQSQLTFGVGYDYTGRRGVNDFGPLEMEFRERFDEDGGRVIRRQRGVTEIPAEPVSP